METEPRISTCSGDQGWGAQAPDSAGRSARRSGSCSQRRLGVPVMITAGPSAERGGDRTRRGQSLGQSPACRGPGAAPPPCLGFSTESREKTPGSGPGRSQSAQPMAPAPPPSMGGLHQDAADGGTGPPRGCRAPGNSGLACQPRGEPGWPLPELPMWPQPRRAFLRVTWGSDPVGPTTLRVNERPLPSVLCGQDERWI